MTKAYHRNRASECRDRLSQTSRVPAMPTTLLAFVILLSLSFHAAAADELVLEFSGTLKGTGNCAPPSDVFCGPYQGLLKIDPDQPGFETAGYSHDYTADLVVTFADGHTASCRAHPAVYPEKLDGHLDTRTQYCLISLYRRPDHFHIQLSMYPLEKEIASVTLVYVYRTLTFNIRDLSEVLGKLLQPADDAHFWVVGQACSWGPCIDRSVTPLAMVETTGEPGLTE